MSKKLWIVTVLIAVMIGVMCFYTSAMAGKWVWEKAPTEYSITFVCTENGYLGEMPQVTVVAAEDYELPGNVFEVFGSDFQYWTDGTRRTWEDKAVIPANTYVAGTEVTLTAVFEPRDRSVVMQDGSFTFNIRGDEKAFFNDVPANTVYQVYEESPRGWVLLNAVNTSGIIEPLITAEALFGNTYDPEKASVRLAVQKLMDGVPAESGSFNFMLCAEDGSLLQLQPVSDNGVVYFDPIEYTIDDVGEYRYTIQEVIQDDDVLFDSHALNVIVSVGYDSVIKYSHTPNVADDGTQRGNYANNLALVDVVTIPGAENLHVVITYGGESSSWDWACVWAGNHPEYTASANYASSISGKLGGGSHTVASNTKEYDIAGDTVTFGYKSDGSVYGDGYGYYAVVTYSGGDFRVSVSYDGNRVFRNVSKPGRLMLSKGSANDSVTDDVFYYEIQFTQENGQSYELPETEISYENREGISIEYPDLQPVERQKYSLLTTVMTTDMEGHDSFNTTAAEYYAGDVYTITQEAPVGYYLNRFDGADVVQIGNNSWKGVMPKGDLAVTLHYMPYISISGSIIWDDNDNERGTRPSSVKVHLMSGGESVIDTIVSADDNWEFTFNNVRPYVNGDAIEYSLHMEEVATYETSLNGNVITALYVPPTATISTSLWRANVNGYSQYGSSSSSTGILRSATSFSRINLPFVEALPSSAVRIDDGTTNSSIYFFMEGTDAFWWSDAEVVYMAPDSSYMFNKCAELTSLDLSMFDTSKVTNMSHMFHMSTSEGTEWKYTKLASLDLSGWDTSNVTDMSYLFYGCGDLVSLDGVSSFNTANVTNMYGVFYRCQELSSLDLSGWDTSEVRSMGSMFMGCLGLTSLDVAGFNTANVTNLANCLHSCKGLTSLNLSGWDISNVTSLSGTFYDCTNLSVLNLDGWNPMNVTDMDGMFRGCQSFTSLDLSGWNTSKVTSMTGWVITLFGGGYSDTGLFAGCSNLTSLNLSGWNTSNVRSMGNNFGGCTALEVLNLDGWDTSGVSSGSMFSLSNMHHLRELTLGENFVFLTCHVPDWLLIDGENYPVVWELEDGTYGPYSSDELIENYSSDMAGKWVPVKKTVTDYAVYNESDQTLYFVVSDQPVSYGDGSSQTIHSISGQDYSGRVYSLELDRGWSAHSNGVRHVVFVDTIRPKTTEKWFYKFYNCYDIDLAKLDTSEATSMNSMFYDCSSLTSLDLSGFDTSNVTDMGYMFEDCDRLSSLNLSGWDTSKLERVYHLFYRCSNLTSLDVSMFDTSHIRSFDYMFGYCSGLASLDVSGFDISNAYDIGSMFSGCNSLTSLDLSGWNNVNISEMDMLFYGCRNLITVYVSDLWVEKNLSSWNVRNMFDGCTKIVGGNGTVFDATHIDNAYARIDNPPDEPGYFTYKAAPEQL